MLAESCATPVSGSDITAHSPMDMAPGALFFSAGGAWGPSRCHGVRTCLSFSSRTNASASFSWNCSPGLTLLGRCPDWTAAEKEGRHPPKART